jgi:quercetin dioxygenase-like cupin family protein
MLKRNVVATFVGSLLAAAPLPGSMVSMAAGVEKAPPSAAVAQLMMRDLIAGPDKEVVMLTVTYPPAGASLPHRHDAQVFVYVLEGELTMQVRGSPAVTLRAGQTFYESPDDIHEVSANASKTAPAKFLVVSIKDKAKPGSRVVAD